MRSVWKYPLRLERGDEQDFDMPAGARVVHVAPQAGVATLWADVETSAAVLRRRFLIVGTGYPAPDDGEHVGSWQQGSFVFHLFEIPL